MKATVAINNFSTVYQLPDYWTADDFRKLLDEFNFPDADQVGEADLEDMLKMAITDFEPEEAAAVLLTYRLSERLKPGQISQMAYDMMTEPLAEEYPDISLHHHLFHINQLLRRAFNGKFPNTKATIMEGNLKLKGEVVLTKELAVKALSGGLKGNNLIMRMYEEELKGKKRFSDAENILWTMEYNGESGDFTIITSDYWMNEDDFQTVDFEVEIHEFEEED